MEPDVRYTRTADGVSIAYWTLGTGPPLLYLPPLPHHVQLDWRYAPLREMYTWLARRHQLVRFDHRGRGLSQREIAEFSTQAELLDIEAIVARLGLEQFVMFAHGPGAGAGVRYAALHREQVRRLVLVNPVGQFPEAYGHPPIRAMVALLQLDHYVWSEVASYIISGWQGGEQTRQYAALLRDSMEHEQALRHHHRNALEDMEQFPLAARRVEAPTLIVYQRDAVAVPPNSPERLAAEIPDARLVQLEGAAVNGSLNDPLMMTAVDEFLLGEQAPGGHARADLPAGTAVILFVDIESSTALTERMGDATFRSASRAIDEHVRGAVRSAGGTPVEGKVMGDGVMATFSSAAQAIAGAHACRELSAASELRLHIGLHAGDVIREGNNVYGGAVNIASRVCDAATPGEILVSATVRDLARTSTDVTFEDRGERALKGIEEPVRVFAVRLGE